MSRLNGEGGGIHTKAICQNNEKDRLRARTTLLHFSLPLSTCDDHRDHSFHIESARQLHEVKMTRLRLQQ